MHSTSLYGLKLSVLRGVGAKALATDHRVTCPSEFFFSRINHRITLNEIAWEDDVQGLGMAMSTVASEKNRELLFTGNVFYKQWHLCVLFH